MSNIYLKVSTETFSKPRVSRFKKIGQFWGADTIEF